MKAVLSVLLGLMLLTSSVGISYATPAVQPFGNPCNPSSPNYSGACGPGAHIGDPHHGCIAPGRKGVLTSCCTDSNTPHAGELSDTHPDRPCGPP